MVNKYSCAPWISRILNEHTTKNDEQTPNENRCPSGASVKPWVMDVLHYHTYAKHKHSHTAGTWCIQHQDILCMQLAWNNNKKSNTIGFDINAPKVCLIAHYRPFQGNLVFIFICPYPLCHVLQHRRMYTYQHEKLTRQHVFYTEQYCDPKKRRRRRWWLQESLYINRLNVCINAVIKLIHAYDFYVYTSSPSSSSFKMLGVSVEFDKYTDLWQQIFLRENIFHPV